MKKFITLLMFLFTGTYLLAQEHDFRNVDWGMSVSEVKNAEESKPLLVSEDAIYYNLTVANLQANLAYGFTKDKLSNAFYFFKQDYSNRNQYLDDFENVKSILKDKYGNPTSDDVIWSDDLYKGDKTQWGFAVSMGHMAMRAVWKTDKATISLTLKGNNSKVSFVCAYLSTAMDKDVINDLKEKNKKDF